ncbi:MAG: hypothetical protein ABSD71_02435 [Bacteroidales bacterium]
MKKVTLLFACLLMICVVIKSQAQPKAFSCEQWRADVKMLTDKDGAALLNAKPIVMDFSVFLDAKAPLTLDKNNLKDKNQPRLSSEKEVIQLIAFITSITITGDDHNFRMVLRYPDSEATMVAVLPNPDCPALDKFPAIRAQFRQTWKELTTIMDRLSKESNPIKVKITGVRFWNAPGGERGSSANGIEIHPVLSIIQVPNN